MNKLTLIIYTCLLATGMAAQPAYPTVPAAAANLIQLEYFVDVDPGLGNGRPVAIATGTDLADVSFLVDLTGVSNGLHRIFFRTREANGKWSLTNNVFFDNFILPVYPNAPAPPDDIVQMEYYIDTDPGFGNGSGIPVVPASDLPGKDIAVNVSGLPPGVHQLFIRSRNANGKWSLTNFGQFDNTQIIPYPTTPAPAPAIGQMEYYIDTDPGFGNGTAINFIPGADIANFSFDVSLSNVNAGAHTFYIRSRQNPWSLSAYIPFLYSSALPVTWLYVRGEIKNDKAFINWATAMEEETDKFLVEHSSNGQQFTAVGEIAAAGNSNASRPYEFIHTTLIPGMNYYRLKQLDKNGKSTYSRTLHLLYRPNQQQTVIAPNPVENTLYIVAGRRSVIRKIELFDLSGKLMLAKQFSAQQQVYAIDVSGILKGTYILKLYDETGITSQKVLKQ